MTNPIRVVMHSAEEYLGNVPVFRRKHDKHYQKVWLVTATFSTAEAATQFLHQFNKPFDDADKPASRNNQDAEDLQEIPEAPCPKCASIESRHYGSHHSGIELRQCTGCNRIYPMGVSY
jgi:hypothetical protein